ncbi:MAG: hypothetical protein ACXVX6_00830 [Mycobacterium sp.]
MTPALIKDVAQVLRGVRRESDIVARLGCTRRREQPPIRGARDDGG